MYQPIPQVSLGESVPAGSVHAGDSLVVVVRSSLHGTTACSALDATCGATNFVAFAITADDGRAVTLIVASESVVCRAAANTAIGAAA